MNPSSLVLVPLVLAGLLLCLPEVRAFFVALAQRRFYDDHMSRPRYRYYDPRTEDDEVSRPERNKGGR